MKKELYFRKGHWEDGLWVNDDPNDKYPIPIPRKKAWKGKKSFLKALSKAEADEETDKELCKGWSTCRICGNKNGTSTYITKDWLWPGGLKHYVLDHNVKPKLSFIKYIMDNYE